MRGLRFIEPASQLKAHICAYSFFESDAAFVDDMESAGVAEVRVLLAGQAALHFADGRTCPISPVTLIGPRLEASRLIAEGPIRFFSIHLRPAGWASLARKPASHFLHCAEDAARLLSALPPDFHESLAREPCMEAIQSAVERWLSVALKPVPKLHEQAVQSLEHWLMQAACRERLALSEQLRVSDRHIARLANHYWGAPPRTLMRTCLALWAASRILSENGIPCDALAHYADASHLIREVKRATGYTPRQLLSTASGRTINVLNFKRLTPYQVEG